VLYINNCVLTLSGYGLEVLKNLKGLYELNKQLLVNMGFVYFVMTKFADLFMGNETQIDYDYEMNGVLDDVYDYDYESIIDDDQWFYGYLV
jgi:hypothetical protein